MMKTIKCNLPILDFSHVNFTLQQKHKTKNHLYEEIKAF